MVAGKIYTVTAADPLAGTSIIFRGHLKYVDNYLKIDKSTLVSNYSEDRGKRSLNLTIPTNLPWGLPYLS